MTTTWDRIVIDRTEETREWIPVLKRLLEEGIDVYAFYNNHFAGFAPGSIETLRTLWNETR